MSLSTLSDDPVRLHDAPDPRRIDRRVFDAALERVRLRATRAVLRGAPERSREALDGVEAELAIVDGQLASARREGGEVLRERQLGSRLGLTDVELDFVWTAVAVSIDPRSLPAAILLAGADARLGASPSLHATLALLDGESARELTVGLAPAHALCRHGLLVSSDTTSVPSARTHAAPPRLAAWLAGDDALDETVAGAGGVVRSLEGVELDAAQSDVIARVSQALAQTEPVALLIHGMSGSGRDLAIAEPARRAGLEVIGLDVRRLAPTLAAVEGALVALKRECLLRGAVLVISGVEDWASSAPDGPARIRAVGRTLDDAPGHAALVTSDASLELGLTRRALRLTWKVPETETRRALWTHAVGGANPALEPGIAELARRYRLGATGIARAVRAARLIAEGRGGALEPRDLVEGVRNDIAERLEGLAERVEVRQTWDDLVLMPDTADQISSLVARVTHAHQVLERWGFRRMLPRGQGVAALFSGAPGTGKTMVAGLIAKRLDLEMYQVDLSKVVSKWVGETEKQLARIFDAAEAGHALLLFDEADSLFARRTEVKSAVDRYANLEVNYLLQRVESFGGVTVLTTNLDTSIDPALRRRLAAHVVFWPPDEPERIQLWKRMLPSEAPLDGEVDVEALAREFGEMTGANIRNAAIAAAFLAAEEGAHITQHHLERACKGEYRAMGRLVD